MSDRSDRLEKIKQGLQSDIYNKLDDLDLNEEESRPMGSSTSKKLANILDGYSTEYDNSKDLEKSNDEFRMIDTEKVQIEVDEDEILKAYNEEIHNPETNRDVDFPTDDAEKLLLLQKEIESLQSRLVTNDANLEELSSSDTEDDLSELEDIINPVDNEVIADEINDEELKEDVIEEMDTQNDVPNIEDLDKEMQALIDQLSTDEEKTSELDGLLNTEEKEDLSTIEQLEKEINQINEEMLNEKTANLSDANTLSEEVKKEEPIVLVEPKEEPVVLVDKKEYEVKPLKEEVRKEEQPKDSKKEKLANGEKKSDKKTKKKFKTIDYVILVCFFLLVILLGYVLYVNGYINNFADAIGGLF